MQFDNCVSVIADILAVNFSVRFAPKADIPEHGRHLAAQRSCPLYPQKRTSAVQLPMSALGQKQTCAVQNGMSALPPKADMCSALAHVR